VPRILPYASLKESPSASRSAQMSAGWRFSNAGPAMPEQSEGAALRRCCDQPLQETPGPAVGAHVQRRVCVLRPPLTRYGRVGGREGGEGDAHDRQDAGAHLALVGQRDARHLDHGHDAADDEARGDEICRDRDGVMASCGGRRVVEVAATCGCCNRTLLADRTNQNSACYRYERTTARPRKLGSCRCWVNRDLCSATRQGATAAQLAAASRRYSHCWVAMASSRVMLAPSC
jgi:hypothetical protein